MNTKVKVAFVVLFVVICVLGYELYQEHKWSGIYFRHMMQNDTSQAAPEWNAFDEVEALVAKTHATHSIVTTPSGKLLDEINQDPRKVLVALVVAEGRRGWPGLNKGEQLDLISEARVNSSEAVENLKQVLRRNADKSIAEAGHNPKKENWDDNNTSTSILFCYWPKAEQKKEEARFLREYISGQRGNWTSWMFD